MSVIAGTLLSSTGSDVSRLAHKIGRTAFLFPDGAIFPLSGFPPCTIKSAIRRDKAEIRFPVAVFQRQYSAEVLALLKESYKSRFRLQIAGLHGDKQPDHRLMQGMSFFLPQRINKA